MDRGTQKIKGKSKCDMIVEDILSLIAKNTYKPGDKLPSESEFVRQFGASRVTIREALKMLNMIGVISIRQGEGTFVNSLDIGKIMKPLLSLLVFDDLSVDQLYEARKVIEMGTVRLAARNCRKQNTQSLKEMAAHMEAAVKEHDAVRFTEIDALFHMRICEMSGNYVLLGAYSMIKDILNFYINVANQINSVMPVSLRYHKELIRLIEENNEKEAVTVMEKHIEAVQKILAKGRKKA